MNSQRLTKSAKRKILCAKQAKALEHLDRMVDEIYENDIPGICPISFSRLPPNSKSDGHLNHVITR